MNSDSTTGAGGRVIDLSIEVPGTPEEVWEAIATGPGISSWFVPCDVEQREGGEVRLDFGDFGSDTGRVVAWEPPRRVVFTGGESAGRPLAYEWLVEASSGDTCIVRLVNSGFGESGDWDGDYDGMSTGWRIFFENLRLHLTHFRNQRAVATVPGVMVPGPNDRAWKELCDALGASPTLEPGDDVELGAPDAVRLRGRIHNATRRDVVSQYTLLLSEPSPGTAFLAAEGSGDKVVISSYVYLYGDRAADHAAAWRDWWLTRFPGSGVA